MERMDQDKQGLVETFLNEGKTYQGQPSETFLEIIIGPMFSGKTSYLIQAFRETRVLTGVGIATSRSVVVNHVFDLQRSSHMMIGRHGILQSHNRESVPCIQTDYLEKEYNYLETFTNIFINEAQFFPDLVPIVTKLLDNPSITRKIYVCGLDGDYERKPIGTILQLIPLCNRVTKLRSICFHCGSTEAIFTARNAGAGENRNQILIGGADKYTPLCRQCYHTHQQQQTATSDDMEF